MRWSLHRRWWSHAWRWRLHSRWRRHSARWSTAHSRRWSHWWLNSHSHTTARTCQPRWGPHHMRRRHRWRRLNIAVDRSRHPYRRSPLAALNSFSKFARSLIWWSFCAHRYYTLSPQQNKTKRSFDSPFRRCLIKF